ncbi:MAG TPA: hypothetical protein VKE98_05655 [Gemmataceae bacterium]|nr:hypothetical protein [Gemmataceae bacterium]
MAKSPAVPTKPAPTPTRSSPSEHMGPSLPPLKITYYKRMKRQRVYTATATWYNPEKRRPPAGAEPVVLRLLTAGAQVVPSEQPLDPAKPDAKAVFYVTPLARGWLRHECMEILLGGRKVQEIPLSVKVTSQRFTLFLLALTILVPWFLYNYVVKSPLYNTISGKTVGETLAARIAEGVPETPGFIKNNLPFIHNGLVSFRDDVIGGAYNLLWNLADKHPLTLIITVALLLLTIISWIAHWDRRKRRYGKPVPVGADPTGPAHHEEDDFE